MGATCNPTIVVSVLKKEMALWKSSIQALAEGRNEGRTEGLAKGLIGQVRLCEQFLHHPPRPDEQLQALSVDELQRLVDQLRSELDR